MVYTPTGGSLTINILVYTHNGGLPGTLSIGLRIPIDGSPQKLVEVYAPSGGSPKPPPPQIYTHYG